MNVLIDVFRDFETYIVLATFILIFGVIWFSRRYLVKYLNTQVNDIKKQMDEAKKLKSEALQLLAELEHKFEVMKTNGEQSIQWTHTHIEHQEEEMKAQFEQSLKQREENMLKAFEDQKNQFIRTFTKTIQHTVANNIRQLLQREKTKPTHNEELISRFIKHMSVQNNEANKSSPENIQ